MAKKLEGMAEWLLAKGLNPLELSSAEMKDLRRQFRDEQAGKKPASRENTARTSTIVLVGEVDGVQVILAQKEVENRTIASFADAMVEYHRAQVLDGQVPEAENVGAYILSPVTA